MFKQGALNFLFAFGSTGLIALTLFLGLRDLNKSLYLS